MCYHKIDIDQSQPFEAVSVVKKVVTDSRRVSQECFFPGCRILLIKKP